MKISIEYKDGRIEYEDGKLRVKKEFKIGPGKTRTETEVALEDLYSELRSVTQRFYEWLKIPLEEEKPETTEAKPEEKPKKEGIEIKVTEGE